jgi:hypothetical protein
MKMRRRSWDLWIDNYLGWIVLGAAATALAIWAGSVRYRGEHAQTHVKPVTYQIERHDVDQVFRDHDGYRVYYDNEDGEVTEKKYYEDGEESRNRTAVPHPWIKEADQFKAIDKDDKHIRIFRDLETRTQGYADVVKYRVDTYNKHGLHVDESSSLYYVEIHLPEDQDLEPGNETHGGKHKTHEPMSEMK